MKKKAIIYLGGGLSQKLAIKSIRKENINIILIDRNLNCASKIYADIFLNLDLKDSKKIIQNLNLLKSKFNFISTYGVADYAMTSVAKINQKFKINGLNLKFAKLFTNKENSKKIFRESKIYTPRTIFYGKEITSIIIRKIFNQKENSKITIKSIDQNNGRGVSTIKNFSKKKLINASKIAFKYSKYIMIEEYIEGKTYSVDCLINKEKSKIISTSLNLYKQGEGKKNSSIIQPADLNKEKLRKLNINLKKLFNKLKNYVGPLTIDFIIFKDEFYFLEMSPHFHAASSEILRGNENPIVSFINLFLNKKIKNKVKNLKKIITYIIQTKTVSKNIKFSNHLLKNKGLINSKNFSNNPKKNKITKNLPAIIYFKFYKKPYMQMMNYLNTNIKLVN